MPALLALLFFLFSCGPSDAEFRALLDRANELEKQLHECRSGASLLLGRAKVALEGGRLELALSLSDSLIMFHAGSAEAVLGDSIKAQAQRLLEVRRQDSLSEAAERARITQRSLAKSLASLRVSRDEVTNTEWYYHKTTSQYVNVSDRFFVYFGKEGDSVLDLRFKIGHTGPEWLFIEEFALNIDGDQSSIYLRVGEVETDVSPDGTICEWYDRLLSPENRALVERVANSKRTIIRCSGKVRVHDRDITSAEKRAILEVLMAHETMRSRSIDNP